MAEDIRQTWERFKHGLTFKALSRKDNGWMYIFLAEDKSRYNLMVSDLSNAIRNSNYRFTEREAKLFISFDDAEYEVVLPGKLAEEEEPFHFQLKDATGKLLQFEEYF